MSPPFFTDTPPPIPDVSRIKRSRPSGLLVAGDYEDSGGGSVADLLLQRTEALLGNGRTGKREEMRSPREVPVTEGRCSQLDRTGTGKFMVLI